MSAQTLLRELNALGVGVYLEGGQLDVDAPDELLSDDLLTTLKENKAELMEVLAKLCPICHGDLIEQAGNQFRHFWCATPGHFDAWRAMNGRKLKQTDAPIIRRRRGTIK